MRENFRIKVVHEHTTQNDGLVIPVSRCSYTDALGQPMAASFHGWLHPETIRETLIVYREIDNGLAR